MRTPWTLFAVVAPLAAATLDLEGELRALASEVRGLEREAGLARADALLADGVLPTERLRAEVHLARGVLLALDPPPAEDGRLDPDGPRAARDDLRAAQALAGPGALRLDATYDLGWIDLAAAESWYARIPEVAEAAGAPPVPPPAPATGADDAEEPDALTEARARFEAARAGFVERLRLDWRDEDTRANLQWIQRRLDELDRIEEERQQQQDPEQQQPSEDQQDQQQDQDQQDREQQDQQQQDEGGEDGEDQPEGADEDRPEDTQDQREDQDRQDPSEEGDQAEREPEAEPEPGDEGEEQEAAPEEASELPEGEPQPSEPAAEAPPTERVLTREEVLRLLDRLQELEAEGERVRDALRQSRRVPVERDW